MKDSEEKPTARVHPVFEDERLSSMQRYALLAVGETGVWALLRYELIVLLFGWVPGALGYWLRRTTYGWLLKGMGRNVTLGRNLTLRGGCRIELGDNVFIDDHCVLDARGASSSIRLDEGVLVSRNTVMRAREGSLRIGAGSDLGCNCMVGTDSRLEIGRDVLMAAYGYVVAGGNHNFDDRETPIIRQGTTSRGGITIGDGAWLGARVTVLDGVHLGAGAIVGAHALVTRDIPPMTVAQGIPAKVVRER
jgi:acetyltransferase-like isoleucine patch superfamily enzyme